MRPFLVALLALAAGSDDVSVPLPDFTLTERGGRAVRRADLRGKVWVASFTFTRCAGACWQINETMSRLQRDFAGAKDFRLVTVSADPERDTPEVQRRFAEQRGVDAERWLFLTGGQDEVYRLIQEGFRLTVRQTEGAERKQGFEADHTPKVAVVDRDGRVRGYFDGRQTDDAGADVDQYPELKRRVNELLAEGGLTPESVAGFNAILNASCVALLLAGYAAIRARRERLHIACMLAALAVSAVFLASYLYLHIVIKQGQPTRFSERHPDAAAWLGQLYFAILGTHTVLAAVITPLALVTAYLGLRSRRARMAK